MLDYKENMRRGLVANSKRALRETRVQERVKLDPSTHGKEVEWT